MTLTWEAPGKGSWSGLHDHFPRALTPEYQQLLRHGMELGEAEWFEAYGMPVKTLSPAFVHGRVFIAPVPLVGPTTNRFPPAFVLKLVVKMVPAFRRRAAAAQRALSDRPWLADAKRWYEVERPKWIARNQRLQDVDLRELDDAALAAHVRAVRDNAYEGYQEHFRLHGPDLIPTSLLLARALELGFDPIATIGLLTGSSPSSRGGEVTPDWQVVTGYDIDERCAIELPTRSSTARPVMPRDATVEIALRERVPSATRDEWDQLVSDARATYGMRDDNGLLTAAWPVGLLRRAMLEHGRRSGLGDLAVELTVEELLAGRVSKDAAAARQAERRRLSQEHPPSVLGPTITLPVRALPAGMRQMSSAMLALQSHMAALGDGASLRGVGIGSVSVTGRACVALDPIDAFTRFEPGDILVTRGTCPAWNSLLALAGGVVTEEGGPLSHAAVIARELGLPALIGTPDACTLLPDGALIEIDPTVGAVRVVAEDGLHAT